MAETAMKFGPEWLRALSHGEGGARGNGMSPSSPPLGNLQLHQPGGPPLLEMPRYKIAEFRYGREEMLALFNNNASLPDYMQEFTTIVTDHCQLPLALIQVTEEEQHMWARSVNSDVLQRINSKTREGGGGGGPVTGTGVPAVVAGSGGPVNNTAISSVRGRGGSVDRGRGRGRGYFQRGLSFEDGEGGPPGISGFSRGGRGGFERSQSNTDRDQRWDTENRERRFERPFPGREENGVVRKDPSRAPNDTWRRDSGGEKTKSGADEDGWHPAPTRDKWGKSSSSWRSEQREESERASIHGAKGEIPEALPTRNGPNKAPPFRKSSNHLWDQDPQLARDHLPEWSTENGCDAEQVGTFDATGAFMETKNSLNGPIPKRRFSASEEKPKELPVLRKPRQPQESSLTRSLETEGVPPVAKDQPPPQLSRIDPTSSRSSFCLKDNNGHSSEPSRLNLNTSEVNRIDSAVLQNEHQNSVVTVKELPVISAPASMPNLASAYVPVFPLQTGMSPVLASVMAQSVAPVNPSLPKNKPSEDENFDLLERAAENMMAQWTAEEEHRVASQQRFLSQQAQGQIQRVSPGLEVPVVPLHHSDAYKWFYRDPQSQVQGPFTSSEMLEWFSAGYFTTQLMVRRGCDERFAQLGELFKSFGRVPFTPGPHAPPLRALPSSLTTNPVPPATTPGDVPPPVSSSVPTPLSADHEQQMRVVLLQQQILQQQMIYRHQVQMILGHLNKQDSFSSLPHPQQQQVLLQHLMAQQQIQRAPPGGMGEGLPNGLLDPLSQMPLMGFGPLPGLPSLLKNDPNSLWGLNTSTVPTSTVPATSLASQTISHWPVMNTVGGLPQNKPPAPAGGSIWDLEAPNTSVADLKALERKKEEEEAEAKRQEDERKRILEEEEKRRRQQLEEEELKQRREMEERLRLEQLQKEEEERLRREAAAEAERLLREAEEKKLKEEVARKLAEEKEQRKRKEAEQIRKKEAELMRRQEEEQKRKDEEAKETLKIQQELERQRREEQELREEQQREALRRLQQEQAQRAMKAPTVAPWAQQSATVAGANTPSLAEIQRLQEEREKEEKILILQQQQQQQQLQQQMDSQQQQQMQNKNHLTWANRNVVPSSVKTLLEIQQEQAERATKQQKQLKQQNQNVLQTNNTSNASVNNTSGGGWGNAASQLTWAPSPVSNSNSQGWALSDVSNTSATRGFWDDAASTTVRPTKAASKSGSDSAFPALDDFGQISSHSGSSNKAKNVRTKKKEEETVMKLFEAHRQGTDEFTQWCTSALSSMQSSVDIPTFTAFLKDIDSPYEVHDYVRSYLGESKEAREFAKQFLERRSKHKNQSKPKVTEENMWGPAPALTPLHNKSVSAGNNQQSSTPAAFTALGVDDGAKKKGKKKGKMQRLDGALLGFRVRADPDRINAGEIDHVDGV